MTTYVILATDEVVFPSFVTSARLHATTPGHSGAYWLLESDAGLDDITLIPAVIAAEIISPSHRNQE